MRLIRTHYRTDGVTSRTYALPDGKTVIRYEVPKQVLNELGRKKLAQAMELARKVEAQNDIRALIRQRIGEGVKVTAIAHECGLSEQRIRQIRSAMRAESNATLDAFLRGAPRAS